MTFASSPSTRMYKVVHRPCAHHHNVFSTGDGGTTCRGDADDFFMCKSIHEPVTKADVLETSYA